MVSHSFWEMNCRLLIIDKCAEHQKWNFYNSCCCCCCCWHLCFHILMFMRWRFTVQFHFPSPLFVSYNQPSACVVASVVSNEPTPLSTRQGKRQSNSPPLLFYLLYFNISHYLSYLTYSLFSFTAALCRIYEISLLTRWKKCRLLLYHFVLWQVFIDFRKTMRTYALCEIVTALMPQKCRNFVEFYKFWQ